MKFKAGDPVWVRVLIPHNGIAVGEYAAVVIGLGPGRGSDYYVDVFGVPPPWYGSYWEAREPYMRPRRDDYQQDEGLSSREEIDKLRWVGVELA